MSMPLGERGKISMQLTELPSSLLRQLCCRPLPAAAQASTDLRARSDQQEKGDV